MAKFQHLEENEWYWINTLLGNVRGQDNVTLTVDQFAQIVAELSGIPDLLGKEDIKAIDALKAYEDFKAKKKGL